MYSGTRRKALDIPGSKQEEDSTDYAMCRGKTNSFGILYSWQKLVFLGFGQRKSECETSNVLIIKCPISIQLVSYQVSKYEYSAEIVLCVSEE
jgi:hypothetical protein